MNAIIENKNETLPLPLAGAIAAHRFAANMKPEHLKRLTDAAMFKQFEPGTKLFSARGASQPLLPDLQGKISLESEAMANRPP